MLGQTIKSLRKKKGISQKELGVIIGVGPSTVTRYETGEISPPLDMVNKIAAALEIEPIILLSGEEFQEFVVDSRAQWITDYITGTGYEYDLKSQQELDTILANLKVICLSDMDSEDKYNALKLITDSIGLLMHIHKLKKVRNK